MNKEEIQALKRVEKFESAVKEEKNTQSTVNNGCAILACIVMVLVFVSCATCL